MSLDDEDLETGEGNDKDEIDEEVKELMTEYNLDEETAEAARDLRDELGIDDEEAAELAEEL